MATNTIDTDKYFDEYSKNARSAMIFVYPSELRSILEKTVELQVETGKFLAKSATDAFTKLIATTK